jgi:hypothetical protein
MPSGEWDGFAKLKGFLVEYGRVGLYLWRKYSDYSLDA